MIAARTHCYLVGLVKRSCFNGRVVEVVCRELDRDGTVWYVVDAPWIAEVGDVDEVHVREANLRPITNPDVRREARRVGTISSA